MLLKSFIFILMIGILISLFSSLVFLMKDSGDKNRMVKALTMRIGLSIILFIVLLLAYTFGIIKPH